MLPIICMVDIVNVNCVLGLIYNAVFGKWKAIGLTMLIGDNTESEDDGNTHRKNIDSESQKPRQLPWK